MTTRDICIILDHPEESRNVGSVCRAMANMGIKDLRIVGTKENYNEEQVRTLSVHAFAIWENARFFSSITEAARECTIIAGTTRRRGKRRKEWLVTPEEFAGQVAKRDNSKIAVVFGNERTGLTDEQLEECTIGVQIPSDSEFGSLNLSHAVQILCYELYKAVQIPGKKGYTPITMERLDKSVYSITEDLKTMGFFTMPGREDMENFWRSILSRAALSEGEAQYLEKIFNKAAGLFSKHHQK